MPLILRCSNFLSLLRAPGTQAGNPKGRSSTRHLPCGGSQTWAHGRATNTNACHKQMPKWRASAWRIEAEQPFFQIPPNTGKLWLARAGGIGDSGSGQLERPKDLASRSPRLVVPGQECPTRPSVPWGQGLSAFCSLLSPPHLEVQFEWIKRL